MKFLQFFPVHTHMDVRFLNVALIILIVQSICNLGHSQNTGLSAKEIMERSQDVSKSLTSLYAEGTTTDSSANITKTVSQQKFLPDGTNFSKIDTITTSKDGRPVAALTVLVRPDGYYQIFSKQKAAVKVTYLTKMAKVTAESFGKATNPVNPGEVDPLALTVKDGIHNNEEVYIVTQTLSPKEIKIVEDVARKNLASIGNVKVDLSKITPCVYVLKYRKADFAMMSYATFSRDGDLLNEMSFLIVKQNIPLGDDIFEIPKGYKLEEIEKPEELISFLQRER